MPLWVNNMSHQATKIALKIILFQGAALLSFLELNSQPWILLDGLFEVNLMVIEVDCHCVI